MMGRQDREQGQLFYEFKLDDVIPKNHLVRRMNVFVTIALADLHQQLRPFYSEVGRPSVDPELMIRMLIVGYCYGIRQERRLCEEVRLHRDEFHLAAIVQNLKTMALRLLTPPTPTFA